MYTNLDYEQAHKAIEDLNTGKYSDINASCLAHGANIYVAQIMVSNPKTFSESSFVAEEIKQSRISICNICDSRRPEGGGTCNECACPIPWITNLRFKKCPLGKW